MVPPLHRSCPEAVPPVAQRYPVRTDPQGRQPNVHAGRLARAIAQHSSTDNSKGRAEESAGRGGGGGGPPVLSISYLDRQEQKFWGHQFREEWW